MKNNEQDLVTIALAQCIVNAWKDYKKFESELQKRLLERGFKEDDRWDVESFISDTIICDDVQNGEEFEKEVLEYMEEKDNETS